MIAPTLTFFLACLVGGLGLGIGYTAGAWATNKVLSLAS